MLIYNFQKEFLGIDEKDLHILGYKSLTQLQTEVTDFADLFVKTPGYIYNFKHVHWIDFITCAEPNEELNVIINANSKSYKAVISVANAYLVDDSSHKAYIIHLNNLRILTSEEYEYLAENITQKSTSTSQEEKISIKEDLTEPEPQIQLHENLEKIYKVPKQEPKPQNSYIFDPNIASKELSLPLDLIEGFIQDFIDQANSFKSKLYTALDEGNINMVKFLSHKLKGVAANLHIEDAYNALSIVKVTTDTDIIQTNLDIFYNIITKLAEKRLVEPQQKYSKEKVANEIGLDLTSFNELFDEFINEAHKIFVKINNAITNNDYVTLKQQVLKLKSISDNMRILTFSDKLEILLHTTDKEAIAQTLIEIENSLMTMSKKED